MKSSAKDILDQAVKMSEDDRAAIAERLLASSIDSITERFRRLLHAFKTPAGLLGKAAGLTVGARDLILSDHRN